MRSTTRIAVMASRFPLAFVLATVALGIGSAAHSQQAGQPVPQPVEEGDEKLEEIIVTAQKREQSLQDVPIAVTAISGETLQTNRVQSVLDLNGLAPGLVVTPAAGSTGIPAFSLRGIVAYGVVPGTDKETSIYLDGVYIGSPRGATFDLPDTQRIEVLRGPQGTLFGRNATAGAISVNTRNPTGVFGIQQDVSVGNYDEVRTRTSLDLPQVGAFSAYGTFVHEENRGAVRNLGAGTYWDQTGPDTHLGTGYSPGYLGGHNKNSVFVAIAFEPSSSFTTTYKFDWSTDHYTPDAEAAVGVNAFLSPLLSGQGSFVTDGLRPDAVNNSFVLPSYQRATGHSLTSDWFVSDALSFKNILAYRDSYVNSNSELDGLGGLSMTPSSLAFYNNVFCPLACPSLPNPPVTPAVGDRIALVDTYNQDWSKQWSDELQVNYSSKYVTLTGGALYYWQEDYVGGPPGILNTFAFTPFPADGTIPLGKTTENYLQSHSVAGYGQAEAHLIPTLLDFVGGLRVTHDNKSGRFYYGGTFVPGPNGRTDGTLVGVTETGYNYSDTKWTYSAGLNYTPVQGILVYGKYSTGYVSGGSVADVPFRPETVGSAEAGAKADFLDSRLRTNAALYYARYENTQSAQAGINVGHPELATVVIDNGTTYARGVEAELSALPARGLTLAAAMDYTHVSFSGVNPIVAQSVGLTAAQTSLFQPTLIPKWTGNLSGEYQTVSLFPQSGPLLSQAKLMARIDANWHNTIVYSANPMFREQYPAYASVYAAPAAWTVNARLALREVKLAAVNAELALWSRNLTNNRDFQFPLFLDQLIESTAFVPPRTYGLDLNLKY
jgi:iron complex outermembrane receptor protein